jgi:copper-binding protein NosD
MFCRKSLAVSWLLMLAGVLIFGALRTSAGSFAFDRDREDEGEGEHGRATLLVDDDKIQCPEATFTSIQAAVLAASPGDKINVCPGTYNEQVKITKRLTVQGIAKTNQNQAIIMPAPAVANTTSLATGNPIAAIVLVDGTDKVTLNNLTIDGSTSGIVGCSPNLMGIFYRNSSGDIDNVAVRNIKLGPADAGCQNGFAIFVQSGFGGKSKVDIADSSVHDYQKNGITGNEVGTEVNIRGNAVTGIGSTPDIAQNGIQLANGAKGTVDSNSVINHVYSLCTSLNNCSFTSSNILIFNSNAVRVSRNTTGNAQVNIYYGGNKGEINNNTIFQSPIFDGIDLVGNQNKAANNRIFNSGQAGVYVLGDDNTVNGNSINEAAVGIFDDPASTDSHFSGNKFYNTGFNTSNTIPPSFATSALQRLTTTQGRGVSVGLP